MATIAHLSTAQEEWQALPLPELQATLGSSANGLSQAEAHRRLAQYGANEIAAEGGSYGSEHEHPCRAR